MLRPYSCRVLKACIKKLCASSNFVSPPPLTFCNVALYVVIYAYYMLALGEVGADKVALMAYSKHTYYHLVIIFARHCCRINLRFLGIGDKYIDAVGIYSALF